MTQEKRSETGLLEEEESRRAFLSKFSSAVFAGLVAPAVVGKVEPAQAASPAQSGDLVPVIDLPEAVEGEHPIQRMMEDLQRALKKPLDQRSWGMVLSLASKAGRCARAGGLCHDVT